MIRIPLSGKHKGKFALIDDEDLDKVLGHRWTGHPANNAVQIIYAKAVIERCPMFLHRLVLGFRPGDVAVVEHLDHDGLNCQKSNLLVSTQGWNLMNIPRPHRQSRTGALGVTPDGGRWRARIGLHGRRHDLGHFATKEEAEKAVADFRQQLLSLPLEDFKRAKIVHPERPEKLDKATLEDLYVSQGWGTAKIASWHGVTGPTIQRWLRKYGIPLRASGKRGKGRKFDPYLERPRDRDIRLVVA